ncbi:peroxiredoxin-like family protein [Parendozoicomonas haliclonae]|uniref:AhpC/TSA family protein n=1 Tax=Parendozoicomonas haliclonae TaxID=1960125 RepID=A0A1X7AP24_9GAMM|nr:peroxiredoxin-like family protein [Parendozoicomonas haliclonae]SMA48869.1 AhpC/TSA family protein [Parendozoicomonas haliclonae]
MLSKREHLKLRAVEILDEYIERQITPVGTLLPEATLTTFTGERVSVKNLYRQKPLLLAFMRASWCPYCRGQVTMLNGMASTFKAIGCEMAIITRETPEESEFQSNEITLVSDVGNEFGKKLNMTYYATEEITRIYKELGIVDPVEGYWDTSELNVPATFIVTPDDGRIIFKHARRDYTRRATGSQIIRELSRLNNY